MLIKKDNLTIRAATPADAEQLCAWWNNGALMEVVGFPNGLGTTEQKVRERIESNSDDRCLLVAELDGRPIGELHYHVDGTTASVDIKVCEISEQNRGLGTTLLRMLLHALFEDCGVQRITLDPNAKNLRAQHVFEKVGFRRVGFRENCWKDQLGQWQSAVDYELRKEDYQ